MTEFLEALRKLIETLAPALAVMIFDYEESQATEAKDQARDAEVALQEVKNHEAVEEKYAGKSDADVLNDAISEGGNGQSGKDD